MAKANNHFNDLSSLDPAQQGLLMAALSSNKPIQQQNTLASSNLIDPNFSLDGMDPQMFLNGGTNAPLGNFEALDESPYLDFLDPNDPNFEFDYNEEDGEMIGELPCADELHDKRKSPEDKSDEDNENGGKRREGEDKQAKKPGRKPLTAEPTNKRKAQNRAAQRAFRERKEKHLKDLETKVGELEKNSESANHENGLLRAQVERLQVELREYRKRLSLNSTSNLGRSPPTSSSALNFLSSQANGNSNNNFQFEFPKFGSLPTTSFIETSSKPISPPASNGFNSPSNSGLNNAPGVLARNSSSGTMSPTTQSRQNGSFSAFPPTTTGSPQNQSGSDTQSQRQGSSSRIFQFNSASVSSDSPGSSSSVSQYGGANSSCGTSPEPCHNSPGTVNKDSTLDTINEQPTEPGETSFCDKLNMACGNVKDAIPRANSQSNATNYTGAVSTSTSIPAMSATATSNFDANAVRNFDWFAAQNGGSFDPVLFGDYREPQNAIVGDGDFTGGFFNDAMPAPMDFGSPFNWADLTAPTGLPTGFTPVILKTNPLEQADALQAGFDDVEEEVVPGENSNELLTCNKIWDKLQSRDDFKDGSLDIDGLCSELRAKARCSETGVVIDQHDVDQALQLLPANRVTSGNNGMSM
ncbi:PAP1-domain-containing protein [Tothia fuscella]|uniref:PAP1-domain-containing protein n=1 Tax=Tothia fuscella TaxID=1048955 RepID=A0A9P4TV45_9PEZI|nr:PAP1-domain-containing protein [Tothia fuscella]